MTYKIRCVSTINGQRFGDMELTCTRDELPQELAQLADAVEIDGGMIGIRKIKEVCDDPGESGTADRDGEATEGTPQ